MDEKDINGHLLGNNDSSRKKYLTFNLAEEKYGVRLDRYVEAWVFFLLPVG